MKRYQLITRRRILSNNDSGADGALKCSSLILISSLINTRCINSILLIYIILLLLSTTTTILDTLFEVRERLKSDTHHLFHPNLASSGILWIDAPSRWRWCGCELSKAWYFHGVFGCNCLLVSCDVVYCWVVMMYHCMHYWGRRKKERECIRWVKTMSLNCFIAKLLPMKLVAWPSNRPLYNCLQRSSFIQIVQAKEALPNILFASDDDIWICFANRFCSFSVPMLFPLLAFSLRL